MISHRRPWRLDRESKPSYGAGRTGVFEAWGAGRRRKHGEESKRIRECGEESKRVRECGEEVKG